MATFDPTEAMEEGDEIFIDDEGNMHEGDSREARRSRGTKMKSNRWA